MLEEERGGGYFDEGEGGVVEEVELDFEDQKEGNVGCS